jgi:hypothetical protein
LPCSGIADELRANILRQRSAVRVRGHDSYCSDGERRGEDVAEHRERELASRSPRGVQPGLPLHPGERNDDRDHGKRLATSTLDLPDEAFAELDLVHLSLHAGQRDDADRLTKKVVKAMRHPAVRCLSHPKGQIINHRLPNALMLERVIEVALAEGVALETNGLPPRLDLRDEEVRLAVEAGVQIVCSTDAHSMRGLGNMQLAVATARRGWATATDVLNTRGLDEVLGLRRR